MNHALNIQSEKELLLGHLSTLSLQQGKKDII